MRQIGGGRYSLVRELGRGGMGVVWLAEDGMLGREVAVKELAVPGGVPEEQRAVYQERVLREARTASRLTDPGIVTVYDLLSEDGQTYIVMEFVQAPTLAEHVERNGPMSTEQAVKLAEQLLEALEAAHERGIVHRDVKPGNVMVPVKGSAKLTDFGIAQSFGDSKLTSTGMLIGSPAYMSPERLNGGETSPGWDLWALGATLFFAVEGFDAFERDTITGTMLAVMNERVEVRGPLAELILGLLDPDPARRLDAARARVMIERARQAGPKPTAHLPPKPATRVDVPARARGRQKWLVSVAIGAPVVIVAVMVSVIISVISTWKSALGDTPGYTFGSTTPPPDAATSSTPAAGPVVEPIMTYGAGGDLAFDELPFSTSSCYAWMPVKGKPGPRREDAFDCRVPHASQGFGYGPMPFAPEDPYPSAEELKAKVAPNCTKQFEYLSYPDKERTLHYWVLVPSPETWRATRDAGTYSLSRSYWCVAGKADGTKLTESIQ